MAGATRELITKFTIKPDKDGMREAQQGLDSLQSSLKKLGMDYARFKLAEKFATSSSAGEDVLVDAQRYSKDVLGYSAGRVQFAPGSALEKGWKDLVGQSNITPGQSDYLQSYAMFRQMLPQGSDQQFTEFYKAIKPLAEIQHRGEGEVFKESFTDAVKGDLSRLSESVKGFGLSEKSMAEFTLGLQQVDPTKMQHPETAFKTYSDLLSGAAHQELLAQAYKKSQTLGGDVDQMKSAFGNWWDQASNIIAPGLKAITNPLAEAMRQSSVSDVYSTHPKYFGTNFEGQEAYKALGKGTEGQPIIDPSKFGALDPKLQSTALDMYRNDFMRWSSAHQKEAPEAAKEAGVVIHSLQVVVKTDEGKKVVEEIEAQLNKWVRAAGTPAGRAEKSTKSEGK